MIHGQKEKKKRILYSQKREIVEVHGTQPGSKKNYKTRVKASSRASRLWWANHLVEIKYFEDTRPQNQLNAAKEQHQDLCSILQGASVTLHIILLGVGGTIYNTHTLKHFKKLGLDSQRASELMSFERSASKLNVYSVNYAAKLVYTRRALSSTIILSHQEPVLGQACNPLYSH